MRTAIVLAGWVWVIAAIPQVTNAAVGFGRFLVLFFSGPVIGLAWVAHSVAAPSVFRAPRWRWAWVSVPAGGLGIVLLAVTGWGFVARVWACETQLRTYAESVREGRHATPPVRVGLFPVRAAGGDDTEVVLITAGSYFESSGVAYCEVPPESVGGRYSHLYGKWYRYRDRW